MKNIAVVGAGSMGIGIAHIFALHGFQVNLIARTADSIDKAIEVISGNFDRQVSKGSISAGDKKESLSNIHSFTSLAAGVANADLVVESITENIDLKRQLFAELDQLCKPETILASNTSSISISKIGSGLRRADKVIGMHFMNPVPLMPVVEIIRGFTTSDEVTVSIINLTKQLGKVPVEVNDYPGFVASRLLATFINEAIYALHENVAGVKEIDTLIQLGMSHPYGPLRLADFVGLDVVLNVLRFLNREFRNPKYMPCPLLEEMVQGGNVGQKSGTGFYEYIKGSGEINVAPRFKKL